MIKILFLLISFFTRAICNSEDKSYCKSEDCHIYKHIIFQIIPFFIMVYMSVPSILKVRRLRPLSSMLQHCSYRTFLKRPLHRPSSLSNHLTVLW